jgi:hypothetical protein
MQKHLFVLAQIAKEMAFNRPIVPNDISSLIPVREPTWAYKVLKAHRTAIGSKRHGPDTLASWLRSEVVAASIYLDGALNTSENRPV